MNGKVLCGDTMVLQVKSKGSSERSSLGYGHLVRYKTANLFITNQSGNPKKSNIKGKGFGGSPYFSLRNELKILLLFFKL
jgi:hypothetical protein